MAPDVLKVERALLALAPAERAAVIHNGLLSLDVSESSRKDAEEESEMDQLWHAEFRRRINEIESGQVELLSGDAVDQRVAALLADMRQ